MGLASALAVAYAPISRFGLKTWENRLIKKGVKV
jgi:hypothetical protein